MKGGREDNRGMGGDTMLGSGRYQSGGGKGSGNGSSGGGRGQGGGVMEGKKGKTTRTGNQKRIQVANLTN